MEVNASREGVEFGLTYHFELERDGVVVDAWDEHNLVPTVGLNHIADAMFGDAAPIGTFYVGLFEGNYVPTEATVASEITGAMGEFTAYSESSRPIWNRVNANGVISNVASRAVFTATQNKRIYGGFLVSVSDKGTNTGLLLSVARFQSPKDIEAGMVLRVRGELSLVPVNLV